VTYTARRHYKEPKTMTNQEPFACFIWSVEAMREEGQAEASLVQGVECALTQLLEEHGWLRPEHTQGFPNRYRQHVVTEFSAGLWSERRDRESA
jgi:hypothetical protein